MIKLQPKDLIAVVVLGFVMILKLEGHNGGLDAVVALIVGYYFGHRVSHVDVGQ